MEWLMLLLPLLPLIVTAGASFVPCCPDHRTKVGGFLGKQPPCKKRQRPKTSRRRHQLSATTANLASWQELEQRLLPILSQTMPVDIDSVYDPSKPPPSDRHPILFRERHGWCPYSERVWLALEVSRVPYETVRIDNTGHGPKPNYWSGTTPQMRWPESNRNQGESMDLVYEIDDRYCEGSLKSRDEHVQDCIRQFRNIFPSRARPSSRAAFLFQSNGEPLWKSTFEETLQKTNDLLSQTDGPFFSGQTLTAADVAWAPFLERYRYQLPALHSGLDPYDQELYPHLQRWFEAMDSTVPEYACRVSGNANSWRKVLTMAGFGNLGNVPSQIVTNMEILEEQYRTDVLITDNGKYEQELVVWDQYRQGRPWVAETPAAQAAQIIIRNRKAIRKDTVDKSTIDNDDDVDMHLRGLVHVLLQMDCRRQDEESNVAKMETILPTISPMVGVLARFLEDRMCVPRDMGPMSAQRIAQIGAIVQ